MSIKTYPKHYETTNTLRRALANLHKAMHLAQEDESPEFFNQYIQNAIDNTNNAINCFRGKTITTGVWTCHKCGFKGFWSGGPHC